MALAKTTTLASINLTTLGIVELLWKIQITEDGQPLGEAMNHRGTRQPRDDISDLPSDVQASINAYWTVDRLARWDAFCEAQETEMAAQFGGGEESE